MLTLTLCATSAWGSTWHQQAARGNMTDARDLVSRTVSHIRRTGRTEVFARINAHDAAFIVRDLFVVIYDAKLRVVAHGADPHLVGADFSNRVDADGHPFVQDMRAAAMKGFDEVPFRFLNPATGSLEYWFACTALERDLLIEVSVRGKP